LTYRPNRAQVAKDIWVCENQTVTPWAGGIQAYKESLKKKVMSEEKKILKSVLLFGALFFRNASFLSKFFRKKLDLNLL